MLLSQAAAVSPGRGERLRRASQRAAVRAYGLPLLPRLHQPAARAGPDPTAVHPAGRSETVTERREVESNGIILNK